MLVKTFLVGYKTVVSKLISGKSDTAKMTYGNDRHFYGCEDSEAGLTARRFLLINTIKLIYILKVSKLLVQKGNVGRRGNRGHLNFCVQTHLTVPQC